MPNIYLGGTDLSSATLKIGSTDVDKAYLGSTEVYSPGLPYVTNGLVQRLDAGDTNSYPGTGTTWTDLSGNGNDGDISGGTYSSGNGGSILLNGNDYVENTPNRINLQNSDFTFSTMVYVTAFAGSNPGMWRDDSTLAACNGTDFFIMNGSNQRPWIRLNGTSVLRATSGYQIPLNSWVYITLVIESGGPTCKIYANTVEEYSATHSLASNLDLGWFGYQCNLNEKVEGNYATIEWYNRMLSPAEITQNFDAIKSRYGL